MDNEDKSSQSTPGRSNTPPSPIQTPRQSPPPTTTAIDHLSYPASSSSSSDPPPFPPTISKQKQLLKDRLYVGNLHPTVDEYTLLQIFQKYGKISKMDFLFHKAGPMKGKPRGYAFVEFADPNDAARALSSANDKLLRGRKLAVTYAHQAPTTDDTVGGKGRKMYSDPGRPTTLSLLKSSSAGRSNGTEDKIAKMEAKLRQMEQADALAASSSSSRPSSLPAKPSQAVTRAAAIASSSSSSSQSHSRSKTGKSGPPLPSLPLKPPPISTSSSSSLSSGLARDGPGVVTSASFVMGSGVPKSAVKRGIGLAGVKIVKQKDKDGAV
ncbi:hypothetical protein BXZ70DRAFT_944389 [Cristinia sonorae]|uniref:Probable RNA-binding protein 18 n=1 Tax=Cristinia sonorae TaxID=1940300 RepID=A0A8K0XNC6_9AGAR|nr:hypothetical protein BXZ70DRAFT_944389 [Cristinia sonorae]